MGTCKLRAGDRREPVIGYRSMGAEASSAGDGLSNPRGDARTKGGGWNRVRDRVGARDPPPCPAEGSGGCAARSRGRFGAPRDAPSSLGVRSWGGPGLNQLGRGAQLAPSHRRHPEEEAGSPKKTLSALPTLSGLGGCSSRGRHLLGGEGRNWGRVSLPASWSLSQALPRRAAPVPTSTLAKLFSCSPRLPPAAASASAWLRRVNF